MTEKEVHRLAVRLCEGGTVSINGLSVKAKVIPDTFLVCFECAMDSACNTDMATLCDECDKYDNNCHILELVTKN